jgi:hypothetical protein
MTELVHYDAMCRAIDLAYKVDEVKDIRDKALALEVYARQALNIDAETRAARIRIRAERKAGELLHEQEKAKGGRPAKNPSHQPTGFEPTKTLTELGISRDQSSQWQRLAGVPKDQFEEALETEDRPSTIGILRTAQEPPAPKPFMDSMALWVWGRLLDFERDKILTADPAFLLGEMPPPLRADALRLAPAVSDWLRRLADDK